MSASILLFTLTKTYEDTTLKAPPVGDAPCPYFDVIHELGKYLFRFCL
jgi:hypothetical protein